MRCNYCIADLAFDPLPWGQSSLQHLDVREIPPQNL